MSDTTDVARLRELLAAATPGPWLAVQDRHPDVARVWLHTEAERTPRTGGETGPRFLGSVGNGTRIRRDQIIANAELIVAAVNALPGLLDRLDAAEARCERLGAALLAIRGWDCLNPPRSDLLSDLPWLRSLVDGALGDLGIGAVPAAPAGSGEEAGMIDMAPGWGAEPRLVRAWYRLGMLLCDVADWLMWRYERAWFRRHPDPEGGRPGADLGEWDDGPSGGAWPAAEARARFVERTFLEAEMGERGEGGG